MDECAESENACAQTSERQRDTKTQTGIHRDRDRERERRANDRMRNKGSALLREGLGGRDSGERVRARV